MISQKCPRCNSYRIRRGYRPTPIWSKLLFRYNLLCDGCNWEFAGFAIPGTVSSKSNRKTKRRKKSEEIEINEDDSTVEDNTEKSETNRRNSDNIVKTRL